MSALGTANTSLGPTQKTEDKEEGGGGEEEEKGENQSTGEEWRGRDLSFAKLVQ